MQLNAGTPAETWKDAGKDAGLQVWRVDKAGVTAWPKEQHGVFYSHDDFLILRTHKADDGLRYARPPALRLPPDAWALTANTWPAGGTTATTSTFGSARTRRSTTTARSCSGRPSSTASWAAPPSSTARSRATSRPSSSPTLRSPTSTTAPRARAPRTARFVFFFS